MNRILSSLLVTNEGAVIGVETGRVDLFMGHCSGGIQYESRSNNLESTDDQPHQ